MSKKKINTNTSEFVAALNEEVQLNIERTRPLLEKNLFAFNVAAIGTDGRDLMSVVKEKEPPKGIVPLSNVHKEICEFIDKEKKKKKLLLIPRGHLKSSVVTIGRTLQAICADPSVRIMIANATYNLACSFLSEIKRHLKYNESIRAYWGDLSANAEVWSQNAITLNRAELAASRGKNINTSKKEPTVVAMGLESNMTSQHFDIIILDDLVNKDYVNTQEQIQKTIDFYKETLNLLEPGGELIIIGTRWHDNDLYGHILDPSNKFIRDFKTFVRKSHTGSLDSDEGFKALFPEKFTRKHLKRLYTQQGPYTFSCNYLNNPVPDSDADFKRDWIQYYEHDDLRGKQLNYFTTIDPAIQTNADSDYTAMVTVAIDIFKNIFVVDIVRDRMKPDQIIDEMFRIWNEYGSILIGIEDVAYQKALRYFLSETMKKRGIFLPIRELKPGHRAKDQRIRGLQPLYANKQVWHNRDIKNNMNLEDELLRFPMGKNDDIIDAMAYGLDIWFPPKQKVSSHSRGKSKYLYSFNHD